MYNFFSLNYIFYYFLFPLLKPIAKLLLGFSTENGTAPPFPLILPMNIPLYVYILSK